MKKPPIPENEGERLEALRQYAILDTPTERVFDDAVKLAAMICRTPVAMVSFVDGDREWFKAKLGVELLEGPRDESFCGHAIFGADLFVVSDARVDERFRDNPQVTSENPVVFYAGMPLITPDGHALGTICVKDRVPRSLTDEEADALRTLSQLVVRELELRRQLVQAARDAVREGEEPEVRLAPLWGAFNTALGTGASAMLYHAGREAALKDHDDSQPYPEDGDEARTSALESRLQARDLGHLVALEADESGYRVRVEDSLEVGIGAGPSIECFFLQGYLAGAVSDLYERTNLVCRETACGAKDASACEFEVRPIPGLG